MTIQTKDKTRTIQTALIAVLVLLVSGLGVVVLKMHGKLEALSSTNPTTQKSSAFPTEPSRDSNSDKNSPTNPSPYKPDNPMGMDEDLFPKPFDPDKWDPFAEMQHMQERMNSMFNNSFSHFGNSPKYKDLARDPGFSPKIDVQEEKDRFVISMDLPGVDEGSIDVKVVGRTVRISGTRKSVSEETDKNRKEVLTERRMGSFARTIELSSQVDAAKMEGKSEKGVFTIILPKLPEGEIVL